MPKKIREIKEYGAIRVVVDIDIDGDVYVRSKDKSFHYIGYLTEEDSNELWSTPIPNPSYLVARRLTISKNPPHPKKRNKIR